MTKDELISYIKEQIQIYESDLDMTTEEDMASFYQGQLEAYDDCLIRLEQLTLDLEFDTIGKKKGKE